MLEGHKAEEVPPHELKQKPRDAAPLALGSDGSLLLPPLPAAVAPVFRRNLQATAAAWPFRVGDSSTCVSESMPSTEIPPRSPPRAAGEGQPSSPTSNQPVLDFYNPCLSPGVSPPLLRQPSQECSSPPRHLLSTRIPAALLRVLLSDLQSACYAPSPQASLSPLSSYGSPLKHSDLYCLSSRPDAGPSRTLFPNEREQVKGPLFLAFS